MIIIINGPLGIGKTATSWNLLSRFERAVLLEGDYLTALHPFNYYVQSDLDYAYNTFGVIVEHHVAHGIKTIIINWVFESEEQLARLRQRLESFGLPIATYRLWCDPTVIAARIHQRNQSDLTFELNRSRELVAILDRAAQHGDMGTVIDTTSLTIEQTAVTIWQDLQQRSLR